MYVHVHCKMCIYMYCIRSVIAGLVWVKQGSNPQSPIDVRHTCEHGDGLNKFGWTKHDGATFGQQKIIDGG